MISFTDSSNFVPVNWNHIFLECREFADPTLHNRHANYIVADCFLVTSSFFRQCVFFLFVFFRVRNAILLLSFFGLVKNA